MLERTRSRRLSEPPRPERQISLRRVFSRRVTSAERRARFAVTFVGAQQVPVNNTTVFLSWRAPGIHRNGDTRRVVVDKHACSWSAAVETIRLELLLCAEEAFELELCLHEDRVKRRLRRTEWVTLGSAVLNLGSLRGGGNGQPVVLPLMRGKGEQPVSLEMRIDAEDVHPLAPLIVPSAPSSVATVCCNTSWLATQLACPDADLLRVRWPAVRDLLTESLQCWLPHTTSTWVARWAQVLRDVGSEPKEDAPRMLMARLRADADVDRDAVWAALRQAGWSPVAQLEWARSVARAAADSAMAPLIDGDECDTDLLEQNVERLDDLYRWLSDRAALQPSAAMLQRASDACAAALGGDELDPATRERLAAEGLEWLLPDL